MNQETPRKRSRGRPVSFDREMIVDAVMHRFWEHGYAGVSINEIAQQTGLTRASLYNSFGSKDALFLMALEHYFASAADALLDKIAPGDNVTEGFRTVFSLASEQRAADEKNRGCMAINTINELIASDTDIGRQLLEIFHQRRDLIQKLFDQAIEQDELTTTTETKALANVMITFMCGFSTFSKTGASEPELRALGDNIMRQVGFKS